MTTSSCRERGGLLAVWYTILSIITITILSIIMSPPDDQAQGGLFPVDSQVYPKRRDGSPPPDVYRLPSAHHPHRLSFKAITCSLQDVK